MKHDRITIDFVRHWSALGYTRNEIAVGMGLDYHVVRRWAFSCQERAAMAPDRLDVGRVGPVVRDVAYTGVRAVMGGANATKGPGLALPS